MKALHLLAASAAVAGLLIMPAAEARAQEHFVKGGWGNPPRPGGGHGHGMHRGHIPVFLGDREVVVEREVVREVPPAAPPPPPEPPPPPRKPYVIGASYSSLPGGCMKMIEAGGSYYYCGGEWYRQVGGQYRAVAQP